MVQSHPGSPFAAGLAPEPPRAVSAISGTVDGWPTPTTAMTPMAI